MRPHSGLPPPAHWPAISSFIPTPSRGCLQNFPHQSPLSFTHPNRRGRPNIYFSCNLKSLSLKVLDLLLCRNKHKGGTFLRTSYMDAHIWVLIGSLVGVAVIILIMPWLMLKRRYKWDSSQEASKELVFEESVSKEIPIKEIYAATNSLNELNFIGQGIAGKVYKGVLSNGWHVAVKHIIKDGYAETFVREVTSLSDVRHPNLVALRGYCDEEDECFLVYELCSKGNLSEWLFGKDKMLSWIQRLKIAIGSARGLWFLHTYPEGCIVHRDIKPANILLDEDFEAKLSDFGLSKVMDPGVSYMSSEVRGTFGYVDPEYRQNHHVNAAGDVYSFGIVLLQILSGKRVINLNARKPLPLDKMAKLLTKNGNISEFADPRLNGEYSMEAFEIVRKLALSCTGHKQQRPSMENVVTRLEKALEISTRDCKAYHVSIT